MTGSAEHLSCAKIVKSLHDIRSKNLKWDLQVYSDEDQIEFIFQNFGKDICNAYLSINPVYGAARADLFRYLAIYKHGGIYLDIKSTCIVPLDYILHSTDHLVLAQWDNQLGQRFEGWGLNSSLWYVSGGEFVNWFFAAVPRHPAVASAINYVLNCISKYDESAGLVGRNGVLMTTGPVAWTHGILAYIRHLRSTKTPGEIPIPRIEKCKKLQLIYSIFEEEQRDLHHTLFRNHYSKVKEPIVLR